MTTLTGVSRNFHDIDGIVEDLMNGIPDESPEKSLAFLICDSQLDCTALLEALESKLKIPVVGGTTFTYPQAQHTDEISASLTILGRPGLLFSVGLTQPLQEKFSEEQVKDAYEQCMAGLDNEPKLFMPFIPLIPGLTNDLFIHDLFAAAGEIPVFGGVTTDDLDSTQAAVFANGKVYTDRMLLVALGGDIRPVFAVGSQLTVLAEYGPAVTESNNNIVSRVDDMSFCDYMRSIGISPEQRVNGVDALVQYGPLPCRLRHKLQDDHGIPEIRCISYTNVEEGSVAFSSALPVGTKVNMGIIQKDDVIESSERCTKDLIQKMKQEEEKGYCYTNLFSVPCVARYFAVLGGENIEPNLPTKELLKNLTITSYYGFCEIGPTQGSNGEYRNRSHNASIVMCAI